MWKLSKLEIRGFKSFADRSELVFPDGITAVVGPNGCGKSNISDAIIWALGEQSTNALRARRMKDVIFQGTANRQPNGVAEVSLHLSNGRQPRNGNGNGAGSLLEPDDSAARPAVPFVAGAAEGENGSSAGEGNGHAVSGGNGNGAVPGLDEPLPEELVITRRLYRSGESEYLIDGNKCRLRDIKDTLMGTGLGTRACFTIEQGRIDQILSASPVERRGPIEEAAGISLYRRRRHSTQLKLEASRQDLDRVEDICSEVARQMRSLKRQAGRARRYKEYREELRSLEVLWFRDAHAAARDRAAVAAAAVEGLRAARAAAKERLDRALAGWEEARQELRRRRTADEERRQSLYRAQVENERLKSKASRLEDRVEFGRERLQEVRRKLEDLRRRHRETVELLDARTEAAEEAEAAAEAAEDDLQEATGALEAARGGPREPAGENPEADLPTPDAATAEEEGRPRLETLGQRIEIEEGHEGALALALGGLLRAPVLDGVPVAGWLAACLDDGRLIHALRAVEVASGERSAPDPADDRLQGLLVDRIEADGGIRRILEDLLGRTWLVDEPRDVVELAAAWPEASFVDVGGRCWARGPEIRVHGERPGVDLDAGARGAGLEAFGWPADDETTGGRTITATGDATELRELEKSRARRETTFRAARAQARALRQEVDSLDSSRERLEGEIGEARESIRELEGIVDAAREEAAKARAGAEEAAESCRRLEEEVEGRSTRNVSAEATVAGYEAAQVEARQALEDVQSAFGRQEVASTEARVELEHLEDRIRERLDREPDELARREIEDEVGDEEGSGRDPDALQGRIAEVKEKIDRLGPVNLVAYDDYLEQKERFDELDAERRDLVDAVENLESAIEAIDRECVERFDEAFHAIDGYFNRIFRRLFRGGKAGMRLEDPEDPLNSGIEIVAQPPGKNLQNIRLMSGGERTLVALSLMFAIFEYRPAPFCILDEADAALDEANIQRFVQALDAFEDQAQFILITHNKRTMEVADLLYGVTMQETGVSQLVSVELN